MTNSTFIFEALVSSTIHPTFADIDVDMVGSLFAFDIFATIASDLPLLARFAVHHPSTSARMTSFVLNDQATDNFQIFRPQNPSINAIISRQSATPKISLARTVLEHLFAYQHRSHSDSERNSEFSRAKNLT
ncbi:hypothetical protein B0H13DRAFT_2317075 [Mycena leptocephala]|nr:hypothetical protein B0H13DRAFT_2317075 [Mycena leptocephala]